MRQKIEKAEQEQRETWAKAAAEKEQREREIAQHRIETRKFWIQIALAVIAAVSGILGVLLSVQW